MCEGLALCNGAVMTALAWAQNLAVVNAQRRFPVAGVAVAVRAIV